MVMNREKRIALRKLFHDVRNDLMTLDGFLSLLQEEVAGIAGESSMKDITLYAEKSMSSSQRLNAKLNSIIDIVYHELDLKIDEDIV